VKTTRELVGIELVAQCTSCSTTGAVNRPLREQRCSHCLSTAVVDAEAWTAALAGVETDPSRVGRGALQPGKLDRPGRDVEWERGPDAPPCPCGEGDLKLTGDTLACGSCHRPRTIDPAPDWLAELAPAVRGFVSDTPAVATERPPRNVAVTCVGCGAGLSTHGQQRLVECEFCQASNVLPDDVWKALHPPRLKRRWWLVVDAPTATVRDVPDLAKEARGRFGCSMIVVVLVSLICGPMPVAFMKGENEVDGMEMLSGCVPTGVVLTVLLALWVFGKWRRLKATVTAEHEVVGRLRPLGVGDVEVEVIDPQTEGVLGVTKIPMPKGIYAQLGGTGARVRAWHDPATGHVHARAQPSGL
jgi:hypothetical protein